MKIIKSLVVCSLLVSGVYAEIKIENRCVGFKDVPKANYTYCNAITYAFASDWIHGYENDEFRPKQEMTRAEFVKVLMMARYPYLDFSQTITSFSDVKKEDWYSGYVKQAQFMGVIDGYKNGEFKPNGYINTAEALKVVLKTFHASGIFNYPNKCPKKLNANGENENWYCPYEEEAKKFGIKLGEIEPSDNASRAFLTDLIYKVYTKQYLVWNKCPSKQVLTEKYYDKFYSDKYIKDTLSKYNFNKNIEISRTGCTELWSYHVYEKLSKNIIDTQLKIIEATGTEFEKKAKIRKSFFEMIQVAYNIYGFVNMEDFKDIAQWMTMQLLDCETVSSLPEGVQREVNQAVNILINLAIDALRHGIKGNIVALSISGAIEIPSLVNDILTRLEKNKIQDKKEGILTSQQFMEDYVKTGAGMMSDYPFLLGGIDVDNYSTTYNSSTYLYEDYIRYSKNRLNFEIEEDTSKNTVYPLINKSQNKIVEVVADCLNNGKKCLPISLEE